MGNIQCYTPERICTWKSSMGLMYTEGIYVEAVVVDIEWKDKIREMKEGLDNGDN